MPPDARNQVCRQELLTALEAVLSDHFGRRKRVRRLRQRVSAYSSSCRLSNLDLELDEGQRLRLVFKDLSPGTLLPSAGQARPRFLYDPRREIEVYRKILPPRRLGTAVCYGAVESAQLDRHWLFLERVDGPMLWQRGRLESWELAARWLAQLHAGDEPARLARGSRRLGCLLRYDAEFYRCWLTRAEEFLARQPGRISSASGRRFLRLASRYDRAITRLLELPTTFIHGEFYPSNVILPASRGGRRVCAIDWELAGLAPGAMDLAALTAGDWTPEERKRMIEAYRRALTPSRHWAPSLVELTEAVEWCQLHQCIQMLGWAFHWSPPTPHARNWLREALRLADRLGL
jgi:aminoglycoside phosphotransferase (APT) family kinase protein